MLEAFEFPGLQLLEASGCRTIRSSMPLVSMIMITVMMTIVIVVIAVIVFCFCSINVIETLGGSGV